jgi:hypothetical protein
MSTNDHRHNSSGAVLRNAETIVIVTLSMIPYIDLLWHMGCSGSLCNSRHMNSLPRTRISTFRRQAEHGLFIDLADVVLLGKGSEVLKFRRKSDSGVQHGDSSLPPRMS